MNVVFIFILFFIGNCSSPEPSKGTSVKDPMSKSVLKEEKTVLKTKSKESYERFIYSLSNNVMTSRTLDEEKAKSLYASLKGETSDVTKSEEALAVSKNAHVPFKEALDQAKKIMGYELSQNLNGDLSQEVKLELALKALESQKVTFAEFLLRQLLGSDKPKVKSSALNALGVIQLKDGKFPESYQLFKQCLETDAQNESCALNAGFIALQFAYFQEAKDFFTKVSDKDWLAQSGLMVIARMEGDVTLAQKICDDLKPKNNKPIVFNCAMIDWQESKKIKEAAEGVQKALNMPGGTTDWARSGNSVLTRIK